MGGNGVSDGRWNQDVEEQGPSGSVPASRRSAADCEPCAREQLAREAAVREPSGAEAPRHGPARFSDVPPAAATLLRRSASQPSGFENKASGFKTRASGFEPEAASRRPVHTDGNGPDRAAVPPVEPDATPSADPPAGSPSSPPIVEASRPREKLARRGAASLSDAELIALVIRSGLRGIGAVGLGQRLIDRHGSLAAVLASSAEGLATMPGLGPAKAAALVAAIELARRASLERLEGRTLLDRPQAVREFLGLLLAGRDQEVFVVLFVDSQNRLIRPDEMFRGTLGQTAVYPREIVKRALDLQAAAVILAHNHPSGVAEPSQADIGLTQALKQALSSVGISVLDHVIVGGARSYSFAEHGRL